MRLNIAVTDRRFHARELERLTGLVALEGQARLLLNDLREHGAWLESQRGSPLPEHEVAQRWLDDVLRPTIEAILPAIGRGRDPIQAYCDVLEEKWILSESAGRDVGLRAAIEAYLGLGAPAPEQDADGDASPIALDIDWASGWDTEPGSDEGIPRDEVPGDGDESLPSAG